MLHAVRDVGLDEPRVVVGQVVVDRVAAGDRPVRLQRVDVVVGGRHTQFRFQKAGCNEHQARGNDQLAGTCSDQQAAFVLVRGDVDHGLFQSRFVQVNVNRRTVAVGDTRHRGVRGREQGHTVARLERGEARVQQRGCFDLLGVGHRTSQRFGVASRERVIEVVLHGFFGDRKAHRNGFVRVASSEGFLRVVVDDGSAFVLDRSRAEARQLLLFFEATFRVLGVVDFGVLVLVLLVLQTEQSVQTGKKFFESLCA